MSWNHYEENLVEKHNWSKHSMTSNCNGCVFFKPREETATMPRCGYPVPYPLTISPGMFITGSFEWEKCGTYKTMRQVAESTVGGV